MEYFVTNHNKRMTSRAASAVRVSSRRAQSTQLSVSYQPEKVTNDAKINTLLNSIKLYPFSLSLSFLSLLNLSSPPLQSYTIPSSLRNLGKYKY